jgi:hypothetical protein
MFRDRPWIVPGRHGRTVLRLLSPDVSDSPEAKPASAKRSPFNSCLAPGRTLPLEWLI